MEAVKIKLLAPACCPNCGYDLRPDNPQGTPDPPATTPIEGLFNYVKPAEPPRAPRWPRSQTPPAERRPPYGSRSPVKKATWRRSRRAGRERSRAWKLKVEAKAVPPINPVQKRLLEIASEDVGVVKVEPPVTQVPVERFAADDRKTFDRASESCNEVNQSDVDNFLANFFEDSDARKVALSPKRPKSQIPQEAPRQKKLSWKGYRVVQPDNFVRHTGDPPAYDSVGGEVVSVQVPTESGRVVAIHNHFYGETVVIPDTP
ncbi:hypothetical protein pipiens_001385 [Culex pipiens pipiens]|uniref:Uncharacterized protein n=1 Tax=Culex pipiens pipiens TaxID=38569 RepID=A0ABD1CYH2_CULPP